MSEYVDLLKKINRNLHMCLTFIVTKTVKAGTKKKLCGKMFSSKYYLKNVRKEKVLASYFGGFCREMAKGQKQNQHFRFILHENLAAAR